MLGISSKTFWGLVFVTALSIKCGFLRLEAVPLRMSYKQFGDYLEREA